MTRQARAATDQARKIPPQPHKMASKVRKMTAQARKMTPPARADAIVRHLAKSELNIGARILSAVQATQEVVSCNTNLGIILLCAPLVYAAERAYAGLPLRRSLERVLANLDIADAEYAFAAISLASPGGLGKSERYDVQATPTVTLLEAMNEARQRDRIACQYVNGYYDVFEIGVPHIRQAIARWHSEEWAAVACYLSLVSRLTDSHIARKFGVDVARKVSREAIHLESALARSHEPESLLGRLLEWDRQLKERGLNPGTSADLTVASLLAVRIEDMLIQHVTHGDEFRLTLQ